MSLLHQRMENCQQAMDAFMGEVLSTQDPQLTELYAAMRYSALAGGKRLRPFLMLETCRMFGGDLSSAMFYACALELIHTYSLIHDDLPAMDNDDLRRGKPTNHKVFGEAMAILAGDSLLTYAFELVGSAPLAAERNVAATVVLAQASGADGMAGGQAMDIALQGKCDVERLVKLCSLKTGALFRAAVLLGAIAAGVEQKDERWGAVAEYAWHLGLAFQMADDLLDVVGTEETLGKAVGSDARNEKATFMAHYMESEAIEQIELLTSAATEALSCCEKREILCELAEELAHRTK